MHLSKLAGRGNGEGREKRAAARRMTRVDIIACSVFKENLAYAPAMTAFVLKR